VSFSVYIHTYVCVGAHQYSILPISRALLPFIVILKQKGRNSDAIEWWPEVSVIPPIIPTLYMEIDSPSRRSIYTYYLSRYKQSLRECLAVAHLVGKTGT
jgi:hypothetical protein